MKLFFKQLDPRAKIPTRAYSSAGYDLYPLQSGWIESGCTYIIHLGFAVAFPEEFVGIIDDRGSVARAGLTHLGGVFDADWRGEWALFMHNLGGEGYWYCPDKAIAQVIFVRREDVEFNVVEDLPTSERGINAFGSSDKGV